VSLLSELSSPIHCLLYRWSVYTASLIYRMLDESGDRILFVATPWTLQSPVQSSVTLCPQILLFCAQYKTHIIIIPWTSPGHLFPGVKWRGIPPDLRSGTLRSITSNNRSCTSQLRSGSFRLGSTTLLGRIQAAKHYLNAIKAKQNALNARKPLVSGREPHLCSRPFGLQLRPSSLAPVGSTASC